MSICDEFTEIIESRNILKSLIVKNLVGRYKNSILGFLWNFIIPTMMLIIYYVVFTQIRSNEIPYFWIFISSALFPFNYMVSNLVGGSGSIVDNSSLVKKMYFPREILVLSQVFSSFIVMLIGYTVVLLAIFISGYSISVNLLFVPLIMILVVVFTTGFTLIVSAFTVYVRDIQYFLSSISVAFFFLTPMYCVAESTSGIFRTIIFINPFTYYVELLHDTVYYGVPPHTSYLLIGMFIAVLSLTVGIIVFHKLKNGFVERL